MKRNRYRVPVAITFCALVLLTTWCVYTLVIAQTACAAQLGTAQDERIAQVLADGQGNVYLVGETKGTLYAANAGGSDVFVVKYDSQCSVVWSVQFGSARDDGPSDAVLGPDNNLYLCGETLGDLYGTGSGDEYDSDAFVAKFSSANGTVLWSEQFGTAEDEQPSGVSVDSQGNAYVAGTTTGSLFTQIADQSIDSFVAKYSSAGNFVWGVHLGTEAANDIVALTEGQIYVVGNTEGRFATNIGATDAYIARLGSDGTVVWGRQFGTELIDYAMTISTDTSGHVYVAGLLSGEEVPNADSAFLARYDADGNQVWLRQLNTTRTSETEFSSGEETATGIAFDSQQNVFLVGTTGGNLFGTLLGPTDVFLGQYSPSGDLILSYQFGSDGSESGSKVAIASDGGVVVAGNTSGDLYGTNAGGEDAFFTKLSIVAQPIMTPGEGTYGSAQQVTITSATQGATIRYTTDGTEPTESSTAYTAPVTVDHSLTLKAKAWKAGHIPSYVRSTEYVIQ